MVKNVQDTLTLDFAFLRNNSASTGLFEGVSVPTEDLCNPAEQVLPRIRSHRRRLHLSSAASRKVGSGCFPEVRGRVRARAGVAGGPARSGSFHFYDRPGSFFTSGSVALVVQNSSGVQRAATRRSASSASPSPSPKRVANECRLKFRSVNRPERKRAIEDDFSAENLAENAVHPKCLAVTTPGRVHREGGGVGDGHERRKV